jgi:FHA domain
MAGFAIIQFVISLAIFAFFIWCYVRIIRRAGYSGWWVLILLVPVVNIVMVWVFAFSNWPVLRGAGGGTPRLDSAKDAAPPVAERAPPRSDPGPVEGGTVISGQRAAPPMRARAEADDDVTWVLSGFDGAGQAVRLMVIEAKLRQAADGLVLGRSPEQADLVISDQSVSRKHALLRLKSGDLAIEDLDSANGTVVDGRVIKAGRPVPLDPGAQLELGSVRLTLTKG